VSSRLETLAARRRALIARSDEHRAALVGTVGDLRGEIAAVDAVIATVRRLHRHRVLVGAAAVGLLLARRSARKRFRNLLLDCLVR